jgi:hypothetical protein
MRIGKLVSTVPSPSDALNMVSLLRTLFMASRELESWRL